MPSKRKKRIKNKKNNQLPSSHYIRSSWLFKDCLEVEGDHEAEAIQEVEDRWGEVPTQEIEGQETVIIVTSLDTGSGSVVLSYGLHKAETFEVIIEDKRTQTEECFNKGTTKHIYNRTNNH